MLEFLEPYYGSEKEFEVRFAAVVLMDYYINAEYIDFVLGTICQDPAAGNII